MHNRDTEEQTHRVGKYGRRGVLTLSGLGLAGCLRLSQTETESTAETPATDESDAANETNSSNEDDTEAASDDDEESFDTETGPAALPINPSLSWRAPSGGPANRSVLDHDVEPAGEAALQWIHERDPSSFAGANPISAGEYIAMRIDNDLEVIDTATGERQWRAGERNATPVRITDQRVEATISTFDGNALVTYNLSDGTEQNRIEIGEELRPVTVTADEIYHTTYDNDTGVGELVARERSDGAVRWRVSIDGARPATPAVDDETVVVGAEQTTTDSDHNGVVLAVDRTTGAETWRFTELPRVQSPVAVTDDTVFATSSDGPALTAIDAATGDHRWTTQTLNGTKVAPVVADEVVYLGTTDQELYQLDRADGSPNWRVDLAGRTENASMALVGRTLYVPRAYAGADRNRSLVAAIDVDAGDVVWDVLVDNRNLSSIAPAGNTVFVGTTDFGSTDSPDRLLAFAAGPTEE